MGKMIDNLFYAQADGEDFQKLDDIIYEECSRRLKEFREKLPPSDYEQMRDAAFAVSFLSKKAAFEIGFKAAVNLILECREDK